MRDAKVERGSIVNMASIVGIEFPQPCIVYLILNVDICWPNRKNRQANYCASKAGVIAFSKTCTKLELAKFNIRVKCICPGFMETPMTETMPEHVYL